MSRATANRATEVIAELHRRNGAPADDDAEGPQRVESDSSPSHNSTPATAGLCLQIGD